MDFIVEEIQQRLDRTAPLHRDIKLKNLPLEGCLLKLKLPDWPNET
jgi:hypothetical protein